MKEFSIPNPIPRTVRPYVYGGLTFAAVTIGGAACGGGKSAEGGNNGNEVPTATAVVRTPEAPTSTLVATEVPPTATATEVPPTATATEVPPTATPEIPALTFGNYDVFAGDLVDENDGTRGKIIFTTFDGSSGPGSGRALVIVAKDTPQCGPAFALAFVKSTTYKGESFNVNFTQVQTRKVTAKLMDEQTVAGEVSVLKGDSNNCVEVTYNFTAERIGNGRDDLLTAYKAAWTPIANLTDASAVSSLESAFRGKLPD